MLKKKKWQSKGRAFPKKGAIKDSAGWRLTKRVFFRGGVGDETTVPGLLGEGRQGWGPNHLGGKPLFTWRSKYRGQSKGSGDQTP